MCSSVEEKAAIVADTVLCTLLDWVVACLLSVVQTPGTVRDVVEHCLFRYMHAGIDPAVEEVDGEFRKEDHAGSEENGALNHPYMRYHARTSSVTCSRRWSRERSK